MRPLNGFLKRSLSVTSSSLRRQLSGQAGPGGGPTTKVPSRIFSGIQPTGHIHLGNYFGAIQQWVQFQNERGSGRFDETIYSIVDLHSITVPQKREELQMSILEATATLIACGIDPDKSILFVQSQVPYHTQLAWVLGCLTTMPRLGMLPQFKEKSKLLKDIPLGLYIYPVLQAADVLLYNATHVPIGDDNLQHLHLVSHIARGFNRIHGDTFNIPKAIVEEDPFQNRIRNLKNPEQKMSKSDPNTKSRIHLIDSAQDIQEKIKKAITDFTSEITYEPDTRPGVANLIKIHSLATGKSPNELVNLYSNIDTGQYKLVVASDLNEFIHPIRTKLLDLLENPQYIYHLLEKGRERATSIAEPLWHSVCDKVGLGIDVKNTHFNFKLKGIAN